MITGTNGGSATGTTSQGSSRRQNTIDSNATKESALTARMAKTSSGGTVSSESPKVRLFLWLALL